MMRTILPVTALIALAACQPETTLPPVPAPDMSAQCGAEDLQDLIGTPSSDVDFAALGVPLRILPPGSMMTMDYRADRLNVELDQDGMITRLWCG